MATPLTFQRATKAQARARIALIGVSGSGKTFTALTFAGVLGQRIALIDTEHGSASKYADEFAFDVLNLDDFAPARYVEALEAAAAAGYDVVIIDSLSHAWAGKGGALEMVDNAASRAGANKFTAWRDVTPWHNRLIDTIIASPCHVIATMRAKTEYVVEQGKGQTSITKVGLAPVQRDGMEYEFDVVGDLTDTHTLHVTKTRCRALDGQTIRLPGVETAQIVKAWLTDGTTPAAPTPAFTPAPEAPAQTPADKVKAKQRALKTDFSFAADDIMDATKAFRKQLAPEAAKLDNLTDDQAEAICAALEEWAFQAQAPAEPVADPEADAARAEAIAEGADA